MTIEQTRDTSYPDFTFSTEAVAAIEAIRQDYIRHSPDDPPAMLGIFMGHAISADLERTGPDVVCPAFWLTSEYTNEATKLVRRVSGLDLIFKVLPEYHARFDGKIIDYSKPRAFFLR